MPTCKLWCGVVLGYSSLCMRHYKWHRLHPHTLGVFYCNKEKATSVVYITTFVAESKCQLTHHLQFYTHTLSNNVYVRMSLQQHFCFKGRYLKCIMNMLYIKRKMYAFKSWHVSTSFKEYVSSTNAEKVGHGTDYCN